MSPDGEIHYAALLEAGEACGTEAFSDNVPNVILDLIDRVMAEDPDRARAGTGKAGGAVDKRRLAGTVGTEQAEEVARGDIQVDALERLCAGRVALDEALDLEG